VTARMFDTLLFRERPDEVVLPLASVTSGAGRALQAGLTAFLDWRTS